MNKAFTVAEVNNYVKNLITKDLVLSNIWIKGEISNFKHHSSGHLYFSLKDDNATIKCVMFKSQAAFLSFMPKDGMKVLLFGYLSVYEKTGEYQVYVDNIVADGIGDLYAKYEELKMKLEKEGLFSNERKKSIPLLSKTVAVVTSETGAVIRDIINVSTRRFEKVNIRIFPVLVQGEGAGDSIVNAIKLINEENLADVIILARGGGSIEDLWPFNLEKVAYAIADSKIPIVSAVGHETDFTIADFVADLRAPTPSAAAELVFPDREELEYRLDVLKSRLKNSLLNLLEINKARLSKSTESFYFKKPMQIINQDKINLDNLVRSLELEINKLNQNKQREFENVIAKLDILSPLKIMARGYSIAENEKGVIRSINDIEKNFTLRLSDGKISCQKVEG